MATSEKDCTRCIHFAPGPVPQQGGCRHSPPSVHIIGMNNLSQPHGVSMFPGVGKGDWCSQFVPRVVING